MSVLFLSLHISFSSKYYVISPEDFEEAVDVKLSAMNDTLKAKIQTFEAKIGRPFEIDGKRWMDLPVRLHCFGFMFSLFFSLFD